MSDGLVGKRVLVTGGTGFIGGRIVEKLVQEYKARARVLLRNYARALRIARYPIETVYGDLSDPSQVVPAVEGCDIVIHCGYGSSGDDQTRRTVNVLGTKNVLDAALRTRVKRFVHLSTIQVYGPLRDGDLDETAPRHYWGESYSDTKLEAEKLALEYHSKHNLPVTIIQPTAVYGPHSSIWTEDLLTSMRKERHILVDNGEGLCNAVYVDDVADASILAAVREQAVGECFLVSAERPVTWRDFYAGYERMLGISATIAMSAAEAEAYDVKNQPLGPSLLKEVFSLIREMPMIRQRILATREMALTRRMIVSVLPEKMRATMKRRMKGENGSGQICGAACEQAPIRLLHYPLDATYYKAKTRVRIDKAKRLLGYRPAFDMELGMKCTEQWARWSNLLDSRPIDSPTEITPKIGH